MTLNVAHGLGARYLYQRRWKMYWITFALATTWFVLGAVMGQGAEAVEDLQNQLISSSELLDWLHLQPTLQSKQAWQ